MQSLADIWRHLELPGDVLERVLLSEGKQSLPSSFHVGEAAQTSIGLAASAAELIFETRSGQQQEVRVDMLAAELECSGYFRLNGEMPNTWENFSGLYGTSDGHVRIHANFPHHRDGALQLLGLSAADTKESVRAALKNWQSEAFETAAADKGLVVAKARTFEEWERHPHGRWSLDQPMIRSTHFDTEPAIPLSSIVPNTRPLSGVRVLDLTRILAGPICGKTLAAYGADVMLVNSPHLPNIPHIVDTSRGKRSVLLDLRDDMDKVTFRELVREADVFIQGYRPGGLADLGFSSTQLTEINPNIVCVTLSAYGSQGPWGDRRGFDSLVQTATGFNHAEGEAAGTSIPKPMPVQILDYASGFLMAFAAQVGLYQRSTRGGSWHFEVSLLQTANWVKRLGRVADGFSVPKLEIDDALEIYKCEQGLLEAMPHAAQFSKAPAMWHRPSVKPGTDTPEW